MISPVFVDAYELDLNSRPNIDALVDAGMPWAGLGMKATEGLYYPKNPEWFQRVWPETRLAAIRAMRYGADFFRYAYHYFRVDEDGTKQADYALGLIDSAGGWDHGDLPMMVDVETAEQPTDATPQQVIDGVSSFAVRVAEKTGKAPILYGGSYIRGLGITSHMGCQLLITAAYGSTLPSRLYTKMGWPLELLLGWQYQGGGDGYSGPKGYPRECPLGPGDLDLTAVTICDGQPVDAQLAFLRSICI